MRKNIMSIKRLYRRAKRLVRKSEIEFQVTKGSFEEAQKKCSCYDCNEIFEKTSKSALAVKNGEAFYERDGVLFYEEKVYYELLYLIEKTINERGSVIILDYGGGMGSLFFQHWSLLKDKQIQWYVVEQERFFEFGHKYLEDNQIHFVRQIDCVGPCDIVILGSSIQYIQNYKEQLRKILYINPSIVLVDRTPMAHINQEHMVMIERVHEPIYEASYPLYLFNREDFISFFQEFEYYLVDSWIPQTGGIYDAGRVEFMFESLLFYKNKELIHD